MSNKQAHAAGWGVGGAALAIGCGIGMIFTGPPGWVVLGTAVGVGTGITTSAIQQGVSDSQKEFSYKTLAIDAALSVGIAVATCGIGATAGVGAKVVVKEGGTFLVKEGGKMVLKEAGTTIVARGL